jgi:sugar diacid utilization regulator
MEIRAVLSRVGNAALIGVSNDAPSTSYIPVARREATTALELASVSQRVVQFSEIPLRTLLIHFAAQDLRRVLPAWAKDFRQADDKTGGALVATLRAYAGVDMNIVKAAHLLRLHPNTVYARLQRIFEVTGLRATAFSALSDLLAVSDCMRQGPQIGT